MTLAPGTRLGPYEVTALIGVGGMGEVYRARDTKLKRDVAVKVLPPVLAGDPDRLARFQREAEVLASLSHPNIGGIHGVEESGGVTALVLELVEGPTLADRIAQGALPIDEALPIVKQIAEALEAAHERGIIHRDLKPANIKVRDDGTVKVLDFGLAKAMEPAVSSSTVSQSPIITSPAMTQLGVILGTAAYMAPEQARGKPVDKRADIWAFGCVLYEMLTGRRAFAGDDVSDVLASVLAREPDWTLLPRGLSPLLVSFVKRCLHKDRKHRVGDAQSLRLAFDGAFDTGVAEATQSRGMVQPAWRRALPAAAGLVSGALLVGVTAWSLRPTMEPRAVNRFEHVLAADQDFQGVGRPVIALSRDGRRVVYNTPRGLYLRSMESLEVRAISGPGELVSNPFFSPDGESVGYFGSSGALQRISIGGGVPISICAAVPPFGASWEPDNTILFGQPTGIMRVAASGGTPELVIAAKAGEQVAGPQLLPDGDSVLFSVTANASIRRWDLAQIVVQSLSTGERKVLLSGGSDARYVPTGHLVYAVGDALLAVPFDVSRLEVRGGPVSVVQGVTRAANPTLATPTAHYGISDGGTLVYARGGALSGPAAALSTLVWVDRKGREELLGAEPKRYVYPRLSPDGTRVALDVREQDQDIWVWDVRRKTKSRLTVDPQLDALPVWTPDGKRLVWASQRAGPLNLYWQAADGTGTVERLTESPNQQRPCAFTPDGQRLMLSETRLGPGPVTQDLGVLAVNGDRRVTWLLKTTFSELNGEVSPNGRWLAYQSDESGQFEINVRPFPGVDEGGRSLVSTGGGRQPLWARNGRELFYLAPDGSLMGVPVDVGQDGASFGPGQPVKLVEGRGYFSGAGTNNLGRTYDVTPDGTRFLRIKVAERASDAGAVRPGLVILLNWFEELKRLVPTK